MCVTSVARHDNQEGFSHDNRRGLARFCHDLSGNFQITGVPTRFSALMPVFHNNRGPAFTMTFRGSQTEKSDRMVIEASLA